MTDILSLKEVLDALHQYKYCDHDLVAFEFDDLDPLSPRRIYVRGVKLDWDTDEDGEDYPTIILTSDPQ